MAIFKNQVEFICHDDGEMVWKIPESYYGREFSIYTTRDNKFIAQDGKYLRLNSKGEWGDCFSHYFNSIKEIFVLLNDLKLRMQITDLKIQMQPKIQEDILTDWEDWKEISKPEIVNCRKGMYLKTSIGNTIDLTDKPMDCKLQTFVFSSSTSDF